jgi:DNA-binding protein HU-beta
VTKQEFVDRVAAQSGLSKSDAGKAVDSFLTTVTDELRRGGHVNFTGFGKFSAQRRAARMGVNPRTGEKVQIPAATVPKFQAGSSLKSAVKSGGGGGY